MRCATLFPASGEQSEASSASREIDSSGLSRSEQAEVCFQTGLSLAAHERDAHAIAQFRKAQSLNPNLKGIAHPLAVLYDRQGNFGLAELEYKRAMEEGRPSADLLNDFGYFRYTQNRLDDATSLLERARRSSPNHAQATVNLAMVVAAKGDYDSAFDLFSEVVGPAAAHQNVGLLLMRAGREDEAVAHLAEASAIDPSLATAESLLAEYR